MRVVRMPEARRLGRIQLEADTPYVMEDCNAGSMLQFPGTRLGDYDPTPFRKVEGAPSLLVTRPGGFGDLLFLTPALRAMRAQSPDLRLGVCAADHYHDALAVFAERHRIELLPYPMRLTDCQAWRGHVLLENVIEFSAEARTLHAVDLFAAAIGVELTEGKHLDYEPTPAQRAEAAARFPAGQRKRVAVQLTASSGSRTYPRHLLPPLFAGLLGEGFDLVLCGTPGQLPMPSNDRVLNLTSQETPVSFGVTCAVLADSHAVIAPDSALCHAAAAMNRPVVALYGAFPWKLRTTYQPTVRALMGHAPCAPCFWHARGGQEYPSGQPCNRAGHCVALASLSPERIVAEVKKII